MKKLIFQLILACCFLKTKGYIITYCTKHTSIPSIKPKPCMSESDCTDLTGFFKENHNGKSNENYAIKSNFQLTKKECCYTYYPKACYDSSVNGIIDSEKADQCKLKDINDWESANETYYNKFKISETWKEEENGNLIMNFGVSPCDSEESETISECPKLQSYNGNSECFKNHRCYQGDPIYHSKRSAFIEPLNGSTIVCKDAETGTEYNGPRCGPGFGLWKRYCFDNCTKFIHPKCTRFVNETTAEAFCQLGYKKTNFSISSSFEDVIASSLSFEFIEYDDCPIPVKDIKSNITTQLADYFLQDKQPEKSILISLENVSDYLSAALSQNVRHGENESISVKNIANVSYGPLPENNKELREATRSEKGIFLQGFNVSRAVSRLTREMHLSVFIFTVYEFSLSQMLPYYPSGRTEGDSFWQPPNYTDFYPSAVAPYLSVQLVTGSGSSIESSVDFEVDMSADTTVDDVALPYLFSIYQLWHTILETDYRCLIMDLAKEMFVSDGCSETVVGTRVTCSCQKFGLFTIVPRVVAQVRPQGLDVIFHVFLAISVIALIFTLVALNNFNKRVKNERIVVQMNLVLSLLLFLFVLLIERVSVRGKSSCVVSALFTHFFMLSTGFFLLIEGITIHTNMHSRALKFKRRNRQRVFRIQLVAGWVIPLLIAIMTIALGLPLNTYLESGQFGYNRCWFPANTAILIATVIVPIATIFICTFSLALLTAALIVKRRITPLSVMQRSSDYDNMTIDDVDMDHVIRMWLEHFLVGLVLILPWALFFMPGYNSLAANLQNIYTAFVFMAIQGILVFVIYVIVSRDVRTAMFGANKYSSTYSLYWYGPEQSGDDSPIENYTVYTRDNLDEAEDDHETPEDGKLRRTSRQQTKQQEQQSDHEAKNSLTPLKQQMQHVEKGDQVERIQLKKVEQLHQEEEQDEQNDEKQRIEKIMLLEKLARLEQQKEQRKEKEGDKEQADEMELLEKLAWLEQREKHVKPEDQTQENENNELMEKLAQLEQREEQGDDTDHQGTPWKKMELTDEVRNQRELKKMKQLVPLEKRKQQKDKEQPIEKVKLKKVERPEKRTEEDQVEQHKDKGELLKTLAQLEHQEQPEKQTEQVENLELLEKFAQKKQWKDPLEYPKEKEEEVEDPLEEMDLQGKIAWLEERERRMSKRSK